METYPIEFLGFQHLARFLTQLEVLAHTTYRQVPTMQSGLLSLHRRGLAFLEQRESGPTIRERTLLCLRDDDNSPKYLPLPGDSLPRWPQLGRESFRDRASTGTYSDGYLGSTPSR
ncbi:unnamed protein product [Amoebophrya sp. A25]|nr:unnamed protein product [Amoebophrya sp. A25]|eukprot:GSA25T00015962001.1